MSTSNPGITRPFEIEGAHFPLTESLVLNEIIHEALKAVGNRKPVVRCEGLPKIEANRQQLISSFTRMISLITGDGPKRFLHINCAEVNMKVSPQLLGGLKRYQIQFITNTITDNTWHSRHDEALTEIEAQIKAWGAEFQFNEVQSSGCIFTVSLLGKF